MSKASPELKRLQAAIAERVRLRCWERGACMQEAEGSPVKIQLIQPMGLENASRQTRGLLVHAGRRRDGRQGVE